MSGRHGERRRDEKGGGAIEFAFVFPFLILPLLIGVIQFGYHYWSLETASATAREAARRLAVGTDPACTVAEAQDKASSPALGTVTVTRNPTTPAVGDIVTVTVSFDSLDLKFLPVPHDGLITEKAEARVQKVRAGTAADPYLTC